MDNNLFDIIIESFPESLITEIAPMPGGVAKAIIVSVLITSKFLAKVMKLNYVN